MKKELWKELLWIYGISTGSAIFVGYAAKILEISGWGYIAMLVVFLLTAIVSTVFLKFWKENEKYAVSFENREIFLEGKMDRKKCATLFFQILRLNKKNNEPIKMFVDSNGGEIDGFRIVANAVKTSSAPITGIVIGKAHSAAALLLECCHKRVMLPNSRLLFHPLQSKAQASVNGYDVHTNIRIAIKGLLQQRKFSRQHQEELDKIVLDRSGISKEKLMSIEEKELAPKEALELNLVDEIVEKM